MPVDRLELAVFKKDREVARVHADLDPKDGDALRAHLLAAVERNGDKERDIAQYKLDVHKPGYAKPEFTYVAL